MPLAPNQQLFEYRVERLIGQGAFGSVWLAYDTLLERPVAIKELVSSARADETAFKRFLREARAAGNLDSAHIVTVHALKVEEPSVYLVTEYLAGGNVRDLLNISSPLPVEQAMRIAADVCEGLAAAHAKGIVHRDIKPENVLLSEDGRAKVGDFGIAHVPHGPEGTFLTHTGFQPGTLLYMSPEQITGQRVDGRSDVYQIGLVLYEMLAGRHYVDIQALERRARETAGSNVMKFQARFYEMLAEATCEREPLDVMRLRPELPAEVGRLVATALAKEATQRPPAAHLTTAIREGRNVQPLKSQHADAPAPVRPIDRQVSPDQAKPSDAAEHYNLGWAYGEQGRLDDAIREFQAALRINPSDANAHDKLGLVYYQQEQWDDAIREWQVGLRIDPDLADTYVRLGMAYQRQGRWDEVLREYKAALRINPNLAPSVQCGLGLAYAHQGCMDEAIRLWQVAAGRGDSIATELLAELGV